MREHVLTFPTISPHVSHGNLDVACVDRGTYSSSTVHSSRAFQSVTLMA